MAHIKYENLHRGTGTDRLLYNQDDTTPYTGKATSRYKNGQVRFEASYKNGVLNGKATWFHRNGRIEYEAFYVNGMLKK